MVGILRRTVDAGIDITIPTFVGGSVVLSVSRMALSDFLKKSGSLEIEIAHYNR